MKNTRTYSTADQFLSILDDAARTLFSNSHATRPNPDEKIAQRSDDNLSADEKKLAGRFMRINHAGEIAAQGLYHGQALTAKLPDVRKQMQKAAEEENDHLAWCQKRATELGEHTSLLNPLWYGGAVTIGALAGILGDKWSLGFVAETENQVVRHLDKHLNQLPSHDKKTRAILEQMKLDEGQHATNAIQFGAARLPEPIKAAMKLASKVMTKTAYWI